MKKIILSALLGLSLNAQATLFQFYGFDLNNQDISNQLSVDVTGFTVKNTNTNQFETLFSFKNTAVIASSVTQVAFEDNNSIVDNHFKKSQGGSSFVEGATLLPSSSEMSPIFNQTFSYITDNGLGSFIVSGLDQNTDSVTISIRSFNYSVNDILTMITNGQLRIGLEVQGINGSPASDTYVTSLQPASPVPVPAAAWLFLSGLGVFSFAKRRASVKCH